MCPTINVSFIWASSSHQEDRREQDRQNTVIWAVLHHNARFCRLITAVQLRLGPFPYSQASFTNYSFSRKLCSNSNKPLANHNSSFTTT